MDTWIVEAADRAIAGTIEESERQALYEHLLSDDERLGRKALAAVRRSPVVLDQRGDWMAPGELALLPSAEAMFFDAVVSAPAPALAKRTEFLGKLRIRRKLSANDFVRFGPTVGGDADIAHAFEELLNKHQHLLKPKTVADLRCIPFLRTRNGELLEPEQIHLPTRVNLACLDTEDTIVAGRNISLYRRLECRERPSFETCLDILKRLRSNGTPPSRPDILYPAVVGALLDEKLPEAVCIHEPILWADDGYYSPEDTLVGSRIPGLFRSILPVFHGPEIITRAYIELGAAPHPHDYHWVKFFRSFAHPNYTAITSPVSAEKRRSLREAYQRRGNLGLPAGLDETSRCLLSRGGTLHSIQDLRAGKFLEDDYPQLAAALITQGSNIAFADFIEGSRSFFVTLRLSRLSEVCGLPRIEIGPERSPPSWFRLSHKDNIVSLLQLRDFAIALRELAWTHQRQSQGFRAPRAADLRERLECIDRLHFVQNIDRVYSFSGTTACVPAEAAVSEDGIALLPARNMIELEQMLAYALAELLGATRIADARTLAVSILPLLRCRTRGEMLSYLTRQGAVPPEWSSLKPETVEVEAEEEENDAEEKILREFVDTLKSEPQSAVINSPPNEAIQAKAETPTLPQPPAPLLMPSLDKVQVRITIATNTMKVRPARVGGSGGGWRPPGPADVKRDRLLGERGEELVYRLELNRLRAAGYAEPEKHAIWTSRSDPGADHDIMSVADDGKPLWIEVKSTMGTDGSFLWPRAEFLKALREGDHYEIWRVYEVHTATPTTKTFRDPTTLLRNSALRLELSTLRAFVEPKS